MLYFYIYFERQRYETRQAKPLKLTKGSRTMPENHFRVLEYPKSTHKMIDILQMVTSNMSVLSFISLPPFLLSNICPFS